MQGLLQWLSASGEFREEVKRLEHWQGFLTEHSSYIISEQLQQSVEFALWFQEHCRFSLGEYTSDVTHFLDNEHPQYRWRENVIFCGRKELEYHVNMVGAELMNRAFRREFLQTSQKAVMLPACMRARSAAECQAAIHEIDIVCTGCTSTCHVAGITQLGREHSFEVYIVPHSSDFTTWLERWRDQQEVGVVAVACVLNLLFGGYEVKRLNIPAQCVLLDYCGCQQHWHETGIATDMNQEQLLHILGVAPLSFSTATNAKRELIHM